MVEVLPSAGRLGGGRRRGLWVQPICSRHGMSSSRARTMDCPWLPDGAGCLLRRFVTGYRGKRKTVTGCGGKGCSVGAPWEEFMLVLGRGLPHQMA